MTDQWKAKIRGYRQPAGNWRWHWSIPTGTSTQGGLAVASQLIVGSCASQTVRLLLAGWTS